MAEAVGTAPSSVDERIWLHGARMDGQGAIRAKRAAAAQAKRLLSQVSDEHTRRRMLEFAGDLEAEADALERSIQATSAPQVTTNVKRDDDADDPQA